VEWIADVDPLEALGLSRLLGLEWGRPAVLFDDFLIEGFFFGAHFSPSVITSK
jgi:hypothetical protein